MKTRLHISTLVIFFLAFSFTSCNSLKKLSKKKKYHPIKSINNIPSKTDSTIAQIKPQISQNIDSVNLVKAYWSIIQSKNIRYKTFSAKMKLDYDDGERKFNDINVFLRIQKDSLIWINMEALGIINIARILIRKDSFFIINYRDNNYRLGATKDLQNYTGISFDLNTIENILSGNPIFYNDNITLYKQNELTSNFGFIGSIFKCLITTQNSNYKISSIKLDDLNLDKNRTCNIIFSDYELESNMLFSKTRNITITEKTTIQIDIKFKQIKFDEPLTYPFKIPKNFKRV